MDAALHIHIDSERFFGHAWSRCRRLRRREPWRIFVHSSRWVARIMPGTTVPQVWARVKDLARALRDTDNALIGAERGVKALAKYVRDQ